MTDQIKEHKEFKQYREVIRRAWLPVCGRKTLHTNERVMIAGWYNDGIDAEQVLQALNRCVERAKSNNHTLYSLGVIKSDLEAVLRQRARMGAGDHKSAPSAGNGWRGSWRESLEEIITFCGSDAKAAAPTARFSTGSTRSLSKKPRRNSKASNEHTAARDHLRRLRAGSH